MTYTTTMTSKGQITVPVAIRKKLGLQPGASITIKLRSNTAVVELNDWRKGLEELRGEIATHLRAKGIKLPQTDEDFRKLQKTAHEAVGRGRYDRFIRS